MRDNFSVQRPQLQAFDAQAFEAAFSVEALQFEFGGDGADRRQGGIQAAGGADRFEIAFELRAQHALDRGQFAADQPPVVAVDYDVRAPG